MHTGTEGTYDLTLTTTTATPINDDCSNASSVSNGDSGDNYCAADGFSMVLLRISRNAKYKRRFITLLDGRYATRSFYYPSMGGCPIDPNAEDQTARLTCLQPGEIMFTLKSVITHQNMVYV
ncbi:MAG: hypothetical protein R2766_04665 [Saprospiraceae bacterium]